MAMANAPKSVAAESGSHWRLPFPLHLPRAPKSLRSHRRHARYKAFRDQIFRFAGTCEATSVETSLKVVGNILLSASLIAVGLLLACRSAAPPSPLQMTLKIVPDHPSMTKPMTFTLHLTDDHGPGGE